MIFLESTDCVGRDHPPRSASELLPLNPTERAEPILDTLLPDPIASAPDVDDVREARPDFVTGIGLAVIHLGACLAFLPCFFSWSAVGAMLVMFYITGAIGICLGYHRILTHRSLRVPRWLEYVVTTCGVLALQGGPIEWISTHRVHHKYSDTTRDPHNARKGFWWCHVAWLFAPNPARLTDEELVRFSPDLVAQPYYRFLERYHILLTLGLAVVLFALGGWSWVIWAGFVRLVLVYHVTWLVNSAAHGVGYRDYDAGDISTNNWWVGILAWGEGWHNNHHAFPASARHGLRWYEFDFTWATIQLLSVLGLASKIHVPTAAMLERGGIRRTRLRSNPSS